MAFVKMGLAVAFMAGCLILGLQAERSEEESLAILGQQDALSAADLTLTRTIREAKRRRTKTERTDPVKKALKAKRRRIGDPQRKATKANLERKKEMERKKWVPRGQKRKLRKLSATRTKLERKRRETRGQEGRPRRQRTARKTIRRTTRRTRGLWGLLRKATKPRENKSVL